MPSSKNYIRDYKQENKYKSKPKQIKKRGERNAARAKLIKAGLVKKGDGKDVDHKNKRTSDNSRKNLKVVPKKINRSFKRSGPSSKKYGNGKRK
tara:strand:- start:1893 stop:2174 length:282 start_codon:yes stop_codon:yes gene_type:complete